MRQFTRSLRLNAFFPRLAAQPCDALPKDERQRNKHCEQCQSDHQFAREEMRHVEFDPALAGICCLASAEHLQLFFDALIEA